MTEYKDLKMKCTSSHPQEPFYTEGKEYDILKNETGFYIKCDEGDILEYGTTPFDLEHNLNQFWDSNFKIVNIDELTKIRKKISTNPYSIQYGYWSLRGTFGGKTKQYHISTDCNVKSKT